MGLGAIGLVGALIFAGGCSEQPEKPMKQEVLLTPQVTPFLMFDGQAEAAMKFYISLFKDGKVLRMEKYGPGELGAEGTVKLATFSLGKQEIMCIDSPAKHAFTFTPASSLFVTCTTEAEVDVLFKQLSEKGQVFMPLDAYPFSRKFAWIQDRFGVSWQMTLPKE